MGESDEDAKLVTLARSARSRTGAAEGAAIRDGTGRTYAAVSVSLPSMQLSALRLAVAMAVASGAEALEAAAVVRPDAGADVAAEDLAAVRDVAGDGVPVLSATPDGTVARIART